MDFLLDFVFMIVAVIAFLKTRQADRYQAENQILIKHLEEQKKSLEALNAHLEQLGKDLKAYNPTYHFNEN